MRPTRVRDLLLAGGLAGVVVWLLVRTFYGDLPPLPYTFAVTSLLLAVTELSLAHSIRSRLSGKPRTKPIMPIAVARAAALAKASSLLGALGAGAWLGAIVYLTSSWHLRQAREDTLVSVVSVVASVLLTLAALRLEKACRVPDLPEAPET
ncbi:MAG TPA: DUF3180 domain-containing protein [Mycobacteriales bacterium]|nr:DUF3180 domain-containing protein [Mycobacteriales bacterium]